MLAIGDSVTYVDEHREERGALVTFVHGDPEGSPAINLVFVSGDAARQDVYGRQIERLTSIVHCDANPAEGFCWRR